MENYATQINPPIFTWHWTMIGWGIAFILGILLLTRFWKYIWHLAFVFNAIGWLCAMYAGFTGNWFIGWFVWTPFLSSIIFLRWLMEYGMRLSYKP